MKVPNSKGKGAKGADKTQLIVALDVDTLAQARRLVDMLYPDVSIFKVGSQLFTGSGRDSVAMVRKKGADVFLDLKFHDIPNTVAGAVRQACSMGVLITNVHALGGRAMMEAAFQARGRQKKPLLLAVTMLTSMDRGELENVGIARAPRSQIKKLALLAKDCGMDGVVCSGREIDVIRQACGKDFIVLTPGIRPPYWVSDQDQKRVVTPHQASNKGADYIVVGRPIAKSKNPLKSARDILSDLA
ncbi:MAG: orotidine-5'-phosphate decarboxylase [Candidatus Omnitrophica bacterium]|nr:orotidine-5'-phosphate decarboxylase [Candidatus Omnitrophota bacterium]